MSEYITREDTITYLFNGEHNLYSWEEIEEKIKSIPSADVRPVVKGTWDDSSVAFYRKCPECGCCIEWAKQPFLFRQGEYNFCSNCGASMQEEETCLN